MKRDDADALRPSDAVGREPWEGRWTSRGVIELLEPMVVEPRRARLREVIDARLGSVTVVMDAPHDPHNGAAVLRSCDAFGVGRVHVVARREPFLISSGVAKGSERWIEVVEHATAEAAVVALAREGFSLVATHPTGELLPEALGAIERLCLVLGNEHDGISETLALAAPRSVRIPMRGFVESLNVSVSAAVLLAAATRNRAGDLDERERERLYARGLHYTVARAREILDASAPR